MTLQEFTDVFAPLAIQLRATDADEATIRVYYAALKDLELEFVQMAATTLATKAEWFPKTSEWRSAAVTVEVDRLHEQRARIAARQKALLPALCDECADTGWQQTSSGRPEMPLSQAAALGSARPAAHAGVAGDDP
jgi:hypothetical protein